MGKQSLIPIWVAIACIWGVLTLLSTPAPLRNVASADESDYPYPSVTVVTDSTETPEPSATEEVPPTDTPTFENTPTPESAPSTDEQGEVEPKIEELAPESAPDMQAQLADPATVATPEILQCQPFQTYLLTGVTTPSTQLLLKFADRVVGGSVSDAEGRFAVPLNMGREAAGTHTITLVVRDSDVVIATLPCIVP